MVRRRAGAALGLLMIAAGALLAAAVQTAGGVRVSEIAFPGAHGETLAGLLYRPPGARPAHPAPGVLAVHGYINTRETQDAFAIELARRGYVVLAMDQTGHGASGGVVSEDGYGAPDALRRLRSLDFVDPARIGLEGHSMGGWAVLTAARADPDGYRALVLEGSAPGVTAAPGLGSPPADARWPRNTEVVFSRFDEFAPLMWGVRRAADVGASPKLEALFGTAAPVRAGADYGDGAAGTARRLETPVTTHPGDHVSPAAVGDALAWFARFLPPPQPRPPGDQVWMWKEAGTGLALAGFCLLVAALAAPPTHAERPPARTPPARSARLRRVRLVLLSALPAVLYHPAMDLGQRLLPPSRLFPQAVTNQVLVWGAASLIAGFLAGAATGAPSVRRFRRPHREVARALFAVGLGYLALLACARLLEVDFRLWVVALRPLSPAQVGIWLRYLPLFLAVFVPPALALDAELAAAPTGPGLGAAVRAGGFAALVGGEYAVLFVTGALPWPAEALNTIIAIQFVAVLAWAGVLAARGARRLDGLSPALAFALAVSLYVVAGTAVQHPG